jgi:hypothetical protein
MSETLVTISMHFPTLDRELLAKHVADTIVAAIAAGGSLTSVSVQQFDLDEDEPDE